MIYVQDSFWRNSAGLGTTADRSARATFITQTRTEQELADQFEQDGLFAAAVSMIVEDGLRGGFLVTSGDAREAEESNRVQDMVDEWVTEDEVVLTLGQYFTQKALFGGSILVQVTNQDQSLPVTSPLDPDSRFLAFAPSEMTAVGSYVLDPLAKTYGYPLLWSLNAKQIDFTWTRPSRTPRLYTTVTRSTSSAASNSWLGPSKAYAFMSQVQQWGLGIQSIVSAMQMLSQRVLKTPALMRAQSGSAAAGASVAARLDDINDRASNLQAIAIEEREDLSIVSATMAGMETALDRIMIAVATAAQVPVTRLFGVSPGGFGTGETELRVYYDKVRVWQKRELAPAIQWMLERKFPGAENWKVTFPELNVPTQAELLTMKAQQAVIDIQYVGASVLSADEVAQSRFGADTYSFDTTLDLEARSAADLALDEPTDEDGTIPDDEAETDEPDDAEVDDT